MSFLIILILYFIMFNNQDNIMNSESLQQFVNVKIYDFIKINPTTIKRIFHRPNSNKIYITRQHYSEIYQIASDSSGISGIVLQQIAELEPAEYILEIDGLIALFKDYELKLFRNDRWQTFSFTTQLYSIRVVKDQVYSFHEKETILWNISSDDFGYKYLSEAAIPYHLDSQGTISGYGKKIRITNKAAKLTVCQVITNRWVLAGDDQGCIHVYDWKFLSHVKSFHQHQGPILTIKIDQENNTVYFSGCDSKIGMIRLVKEQWKLGTSVRGQSHDILSLQLYNDYLISGGLTTDLCFYSLDNGQLTQNFAHKVSYFSSNRIQNQGKFILINNRNSLQIWQIGSSLLHTELLVKYQLLENKFLIDCKIYHQQIQEETYLILMITNQSTIGWKFNKETGLVKYITIANQYQIIHVLPKHCFLGVRIDGFIEKVNCKNGKIEQITNCQVQFPTDIKLLANNIVLIGSKITKNINIINIKRQQITKTYNFQNTFTYIDQLQVNHLLIQYFNNNKLFKFNLESEMEEEIAILPVSIIRYGGWLSTLTKNRSKGTQQLKTNLKKYWYGVSQGKIVIIPNLHKNGKKKIRVKQTDRIAQTIKPNGKHLKCNLAIIPFNFKRMIDELPLKPIFTKKII